MMVIATVKCAGISVQIRPGNKFKRIWDEKG